jgi:threonine dehydrogenase-like Zn-dependent dehydrogenase
VGRAVGFLATGRAELIESDDPDVGPDEVAGDTVVTLISPGTELEYFSSAELGPEVSRREQDGTPLVPGYSAVFRIDELGADVEHLAAGQLVYCMGGHRSRQHHPAKNVMPLPAGLDPAEAVFARIAGVSMTTLVTTAARPPAPVLVFGLGLVGNLAAQAFQAAGFDVTAVDLLESRVDLARASGIRDARTTVGDGDLRPPRLVVECSGHEEAVLRGCTLVQEGGEVVLVGVPWRRQGDASAHELLKTIFHRYVHLRGGWEWELPVEAEPWRPGSIRGNHALALRWLHEGKLEVRDLADDVRPEDAQQAYEALLRHDGALTRRFRWDWTG